MDLKTILRYKQLLDEFLEDLEFDGICGFWSDLPFDDDEVSVVDQPISVYIIIDKEWLDFQPTPTRAVNSLKSNINKIIQDFLGIEVYVGSYVKNCSNL